MFYQFSHIPPEVDTELLERIWNKCYNQSESALVGHHQTEVFIASRPWSQDTELQKMVDISKEILNRSGFQVLDELDPRDDIHIEFHNYYSDGQKIQSNFYRHCDDEGWISECVTLIYYLEKSPTLDGGNLFLYPNKDDTNPIICEIQTGKMLMIHGSVYHEIENLTGTGNRRCIVIQLRRS